MIQETKTFSMSDMAKTVSDLMFAHKYFKEQALFYKSAFDKEAGAGENRELLPLSPVGELYRRLMWENTTRMVVTNRRIMQLQGIADTTMLADLDY